MNNDTLTVQIYPKMYICYKKNQNQINGGSVMTINITNFYSLINYKSRPAVTVNEMIAEHQSISDKIDKLVCMERSE